MHVKIWINLFIHKSYNIIQSDQILAWYEYLYIKNTNFDFSLTRFFYIFYTSFKNVTINIVILYALAQTLTLLPVIRFVSAKPTPSRATFVIVKWWQFYCNGDSFNAMVTVLLQWWQFFICLSRLSQTIKLTRTEKGQDKGREVLLERIWGVGRVN